MLYLLTAPGILTAEVRGVIPPSLIAISIDPTHRRMEIEACFGKVEAKWQKRFGNPKLSFRQLRISAARRGTRPVGEGASFYSHVHGEGGVSADRRSEEKNFPDSPNWGESRSAGVLAKLEADGYLYTPYESRGGT